MGTSWRRTSFVGSNGTTLPESVRRRGRGLPSRRIRGHARRHADSDQPDRWSVRRRILAGRCGNRVPAPVLRHDARAGSTGLRLSAAGAAFANACAGNALDIDDDAIFTRGHPRRAADSNGLAVGEKVGASGREAAGSPGGRLRDRDPGWVAAGTRTMRLPGGWLVGIGWHAPPQRAA